MSDTTESGTRIEVVYEGGVFRPLRPLQGVEDRRPATVVLGPRVCPGAFADVAWNLTAAEAAALTAVIEDEFERVNGDW